MMHMKPDVTCKRLCLASLLRLAVVLATYSHTQANASGLPARPAEEFLNSIGVASTFEDRGQAHSKTVEMLRYGGFRWLRGGIEGVTGDGPVTIDTFLAIHKETGVKISWGLGSGGNDLDKLLATGRVLANAGALLAFEGNNEPNNWPVVYHGKEGGGTKSWLPVAGLQADLYRSVKSDPLLATYPVWSISESGAQTDNVGLQFLQIPEGADTLMPPGTRYADYANVHNYPYHPNVPLPSDNKSWDASDPGRSSRVDGLYGNFGKTWGRGHQGYLEEDLAQLPKVTTETGVAVSGEVDEALQASNLINIYLSQFARGYSYTAVYLLRDRTDEEGVQTYGFFRPDYSPRMAAHYLHNLTLILADDSTMIPTGLLEYSIEPEYETVHDLLLQRSDGAFQLVLWGEALKGENTVTVKFNRTAAKAAVFDPTIDTLPQTEYVDADEIIVKISNHPVIITVQ
ncbi:glycosyl hydrolase [Rhizobium sp. CECT 9324]|uniref:glycosyl hydrolase n=1 Tax=Rhizobium sp. CECT 9324 TaxID=2845820 RepID=UPI001E5A563F|nr:glycosyl hydrolase [Rhizobium sp. CECT 9324]CAH0342913.1 hypothetical protein RHI9324_04645 [Rhizobium sp. CECT 9324]